MVSYEFTRIIITEIFYRHHDLSDWDLYKDIYAINDQGVNGNVEDEVMRWKNTHSKVTVIPERTQEDLVGLISDVVLKH